ncbi:hypothetical protein D3C72_764760 [compost metagenome]
MPSPIRKITFRISLLSFFLSAWAAEFTTPPESKVVTASEASNAVGIIFFANLMVMIFLPIMDNLSDDRCSRHSLL